jgi:hypothetical protein
MIKVYPANKNLGCLGISIGQTYIDIFLKPYIGIFINSPLLNIFNPYRHEYRPIKTKAYINLNRMHVFIKP